MSLQKKFSIEMAPFVHLEVAIDRVLSVRFGRNDGDGAPAVELGAQPIGVEGSVGEQGADGDAGDHGSYGKHWRRRWLPRHRRLRVDFRLLAVWRGLRQPNACARGRLAHLRRFFGSAVRAVSSSRPDDQKASRAAAVKDGRRALSRQISTARPNPAHQLAWPSPPRRQPVNSQSSQRAVAWGAPLLGLGRPQGVPLHAPDTETLTSP